LSVEHAGDRWKARVREFALIHRGQDILHP
jgi:hypothetical protein